MTAAYLVALDQGTSSTRAIVYEAIDLRPVFVAQRELTQHYPADGWVEHDAEQIWQDTLAVLAEARDFAGGRGVAALGLTNQRETVLLWERANSRPLHRAIVWQDRRTAARCAELKAEGLEEFIHTKTGLLLDPYFSATKLGWLLDHTSARARAAKGEVLAGTIDSYLIWRLTKGQVFATDVSNASRTMLFSLATMGWDDELLALAGIPRNCLPEIRDCAADYGCTELLGDRPVPIGGVAGDQQAAAIGQACIEPGAAKVTFGTGCFVIVQGSSEPLIPGGGLLGTVGYCVAGRTSYAVEGSIFAAGTVIKWLRDKLGLINAAAETGPLAASVADSGGAYLVPALAGLGAPHWEPAARAAFVGLSAATGRAELVRAALEAIAYQTWDLFAAMKKERAAPAALRIDGGMAVNDWFVQFLANIIDLPISRPRNIECTATGVAFLAGLQAGNYSSFDEIRNLWVEDRRFEPTMAAAERLRLLANWQAAVKCVLAHAGQMKKLAPAN